MVPKGKPETIHMMMGRRKCDCTHPLIFRYFMIHWSRDTLIFYFCLWKLSFVSIYSLWASFEKWEFTLIFGMLHQNIHNELGFGWNLISKVGGCQMRQHKDLVPLNRARILIFRVLNPNGHHVMAKILSLVVPHKCIP